MKYSVFYDFCMIVRSNYTISERQQIIRLNFMLI